MNIYLFAIGGTGSRVLRSLSFCLASGIACLPADTRIIPMIIDYDRNNGDKKRCLDNLSHYRALREAAYEGMAPDPDERNYFMPKFEYLNQQTRAAGNAGTQPQLGRDSFEFSFGLGSNQAGTFADSIGYAKMQGPTSLTRDLLASLYNDEPAEATQTELNLNLSVGFKGNPNIGSLVFDNLKNDAEFEAFTRAFDPTQDRIFIISSIFGGTGSSGFPRIVDAIRSSNITGFDTAPLGAAIVMPYYKVATPKEGGAIYSDIFNSKQKAALSYYNQADANGLSLLDKLTSAYFIADDNQSTLEYAEGADRQKNQAHIVELLAALAVIDFAKIDFAKKKDVKKHEYEYGLKGDSQPITLADVFEPDLEKYFKPLTSLALTLRYYEEYVKTNCIKASASYYKGLNVANEIGGADFYRELDAYLQDFNSWLDEMASQSDSFKPFLRQTQDGEAPQAADLGDYVNGYEAKAGSLFRHGVSYKDFTQDADKSYHDYWQKNMPNPYYALLSVWYYAAQKATDKILRQPIN